MVTVAATLNGIPATAHLDSALFEIVGDTTYSLIRLPGEDAWRILRAKVTERGVEIDEPDPRHLPWQVPLGCYLDAVRKLPPTQQPDALTDRLVEMKTRMSYGQIVQALADEDIDLSEGALKQRLRRARGRVRHPSVP